MDWLLNRPVGSIPTVINPGETPGGIAQFEAINMKNALQETKKRQLTTDETIIEIKKRINIALSDCMSTNPRNDIKIALDQAFKDGLLHTLPVWDLEKDKSVTLMLPPVIHTLEFSGVFE